VRGIAFKLAQDAFKRATDRLVAIFPYSASGKWDFISIIPLLYIFDADTYPYRLFYHNSLPSSDAHPSRKTFYEAALSLDYDNLTDYLVDYSFLNFARRLVPREEFRLPPDQFPEYRGLSELIPFIHGPNSERFSEQNYYVTHLVYARSHYGSRAGYKCSFEKEILDYLERNYPNVRSKNIDLDLLAEFAHCLKIYGKDDSPLVANAIEYLLRKQKRDGSWGTREDKAGDPYDAFHPTWTAVVAIQYSSFAVKTPQTPVVTLSACDHPSKIPRAILP
jgi:hypothetical protein